MRPPIELSELKPEARQLVEAITAANDPAFGALDTLDALLNAGSRIEHGSFTRLSLHESLWLPELDLRPLRNLEMVSANAVGWARTFSRVLLGEQPHLTKLLLGSHGLTSIDLEGCNALLDLDVSHNALSSLALPEKAPLEILDVTANALTTIDLSPHRALARLEVSRNQLTSLDVSDCDELRGLLCTDNPLQRLVLPKQAPLKKLSVSRCPLGEIDVSFLSLLETLFCDACGLEILDISANGKLTQLSCNDNRLRTLDVSRSPLLGWLSVTGNPLGSLDVRALDALSTLAVGEGIEIRCTEQQKHALPSLRTLFGIPSHENLADMDLWELDRVARSHNWDDGTDDVLAIVHHPRCDLGTALAIYWNGEPEELSTIARAEDAEVHDRPVVELLRAIEQRAARNEFATKHVRFAGRETDEARIPKAMCQRIE